MFRLIATIGLALAGVAGANAKPPAKGDSRRIMLAELALAEATFPEAATLAAACSRRWGKDLPVKESDVPLSSLPPGTSWR
jgi:hypothetical protein